jgi:hypothetical protein
MLQLLDVVGDSYSMVLVIVNFSCFGAVISLSVIAYCLSVIYRKAPIPWLLSLIILFVIHFIMLDNLGIPLIVPPVNTPYFTEFMHIMQYIASIAILLLCAIIFITAVLSKLDKFYGRTFMSAFLCLIILVVIHYYIEENFGVLLIFPPNLW